MQIKIYIGLGVEQREKFEKLDILLSEYRKIMLKIRAILNNWTTTVRMETGFSLNNRPKRAENTTC